MILCCTLVALVVASWFVLDWTDDGSEKYPGGVVIRDAAGNILRVSLGEGDIDCRPYYEADPEDWIVKALVASEDGSYFTHFGVRPLSVLRAAMQNLFYGRRISGASTLSMQAVRLIKPHPKSLWCKYKEAIYAMQMERKKSKLWILSQYLNRAPFGSNLVGIESAANGWFGKGAKALGLGEAAMLAGMVQAPSRFRPDRGYERALKRRDYVLSRMLELGMIDDHQIAAAKSVRPEVMRAPRPFKAPYYCDWLMKSGEQSALDPDMQAIAEQVIAGKSAKTSSAAVIVRVSDGAVLAMACSDDYFDKNDGQVNTATSFRPAGSTLKPFLTALALDKGLVTPSSKLLDAPKSFKGYRPANFDGHYRGLVSVRDALVLSLNIPFVKILNRLGVTDFADTLRRLGLTRVHKAESELGLGLAIGNAEVTLLELARAYRVLAMGGGKVFSSGASYWVADILSGEERSSAALGHVADTVLPRFAWKTGTSSAYRDAWTIAWNPEYVIAVWCGYKTGGFGDTSLVGAKAAAPLAWAIARQLYPQANWPWYEKPADAKKLAERRPLMENETEKLEIIHPEDGSTYRIVPGFAQQRLVCETSGVAVKTHLWWFVDDRPVGESESAKPFVIELTPGAHRLTAVSEKESATVTLTVLSE